MGFHLLARRVHRGTGPRHGLAVRLRANAEGTTEAMASKVAVIIAGREGYDAAKAQADERDEMTSEAYGGAWSGTEFILTHRPEELADDPSVIALNCSVTEAIARARSSPATGTSRSSAPTSPGRRSSTTSSTSCRSTSRPSSSATGSGSSTCPADVASTGSSRRSTKRTGAASVGPTDPSGDPCLAGGLDGRSLLDHRRLAKVRDLAWGGLQELGP